MLIFAKTAIKIGDLHFLSGPHEVPHNTPGLQEALQAGQVIKLQQPQPQSNTGGNKK